MKGFRRFFCLLIVIAIGVAVFSHKAPTQVMGEASLALRHYYHVKKADEINSRKIHVFRDGVEVSLTSKEKPYMTENMEMMVPVETAARIFGCSVDVAGEGGVIFSQGGNQLETQAGSDTYTVNETEESRREPVIWHNGGLYVSVELLADTFGLSYVWDDTLNQMELKRDGGRGDIDAELPASYDMRSFDRLSPVRSQGNLGTCWAFAALSALESSLLPGQPRIFSPDHMSMMSGYNMTQQDGGDFNMALAYLAAWKGPVEEKDDPYGDGVTDERLTAVAHLQEAVNIGEKDYKAIKETILKYGGVQSSFYSDMETATDNSDYYNSKNQAYFYPGANVANHDIVIVGWDDHYPKENFNVHPKNDGAFLCRNSWGSAFGDGGYFYISYEDTNIGVNNLAYTRVDPVDNYDMIYQSDLLGWVGTIGYGAETGWFANVYTAQSEQLLRAVSFYTTGEENFYDIYIVRDFSGTASFDTMEHMKSGYIPSAGYYTLDLAGELPLKAGERFAVVVRLTTTGSQRPVAIEYDTGELTRNVDLSDGEGYLSYNGKDWESTEAVYQCNVCLKVFTDRRED